MPKKKAVKKVTVAKGVKIPKKAEAKMRKKPGSSNAGKYDNVKKGEFAGAAGGASKYSYPINTKKRAKAAIALAHNAPNPEGIKAKVRKKYPDLGENKPKRRAVPTSQTYVKSSKPIGVSRLKK